MTLPDGQHLYAVVKGRRKEADKTWWYDLQIHLPNQSGEQGRLVVLPAAVTFRAPAVLCEPVDGQPYDGIPTEQHGVAPDWKVEKPLHAGAGPSLLVHRGDCRAQGPYRPATAREARAALDRADARPCRTCRPDRPLNRAT
ncbi:DUF6233 domain-containing protein [Streptomyces sp. NPDC001770]